MTIFGPYSSGSEFSEVHDRLMGKDEYDDLTIHPSELETSTYRKFHRKLATSATVTNLRIGLTLLVVSLLLNGLQAIALLRLHKATHFDESTKAYTPAKDAIQYQTQVFSRSLEQDPSPYQGWPDEQIDRNWKDLYQDGLYLEITESEKLQMLNSTLRAPEAGHHDNYMIGLSVFHELECLDQLRQALHPDRYGTHLHHPNGTVNDTTWMNISHCIDFIRQESMCHADPYPYVYMYQPLLHKTKIRYDTARTCRNFETLHQWAAKRNLGEYRDTAFYAKDEDIVPMHYGP